MNVYTNISPNKGSRNGQPINIIAIHCMAGHMTANQCVDYFAKSSTQASANYCIGKDGDIGISVPLEFRSWCTSSGQVDRSAITIECSSDSKHPYAFDAPALKTLYDLVENIMKMYNKDTLIYIPDKEKGLAYQPKSNEMKIVLHRWTSAKACPGDAFVSILPTFCQEINNRLKNNQNQTTNEQPIQDNLKEEKEEITKEILKQLKEKIDNLFKVYGV